MRGTSWSFCVLAPTKVVNRTRSPFLVPISFLALRVSRASRPPPSREQEVLRAAPARLCPGSADEQEDLCAALVPHVRRRAGGLPCGPCAPLELPPPSSPRPPAVNDVLQHQRRRPPMSATSVIDLTPPHPAPAKSPVRRPGYRPPTPAKDPPAYPRPDLTFSLPVQDPAFPTSSSSAGVSYTGIDGSHSQVYEFGYTEYDLLQAQSAEFGEEGGGEIG